MNILLAPDKFKDSLSAQAVCDAMEAGIRRFDPTIHVRQLPLADGGEGTLEVLRSHLNLEPVRVATTDPLFRPMEADYLIGEGKAFIEMAAASGLVLLSPAERDCRKTSTYGTGLLIADALQKGATDIYLFVGGSATNDAGTGMAQALGYRFLDESGQALSPIGENLVRISRIGLPEQVLPAVRFTVVCDVQNPLYGPNGAAHVYGPQKGASPEGVAELDLGLRQIATLFREQLGQEVAQVPGAGAAGGIAAGALAFFQATIRPGIQTLMQLAGFDAAAREADLIFTGEGKLDSQTLAGKVIAGIAEAAQQWNKPVCVICGVLEVAETELQKRGIARVLPLMDGTLSREEAMQHADKWVEQRAFELLRDW